MSSKKTTKKCKCIKCCWQKYVWLVNSSCIYISIYAHFYIHMYVCVHVFMSKWVRKCHYPDDNICSHISTEEKKITKNKNKIKQYEHIHMHLYMFV